MSAAAYGWSCDHKRHLVPGRLLLTVPGLRGNDALGAELKSRLSALPPLRLVEPHHWTGRVLIYFDASQIDAPTIEELVQLIAAGQDAAAGRESVPGGPPAAAGSTATAESAPAGGTQPPRAWHAEPLSEVLRALQTSVPKGLNQAEAAARCEIYGYNRLRSSKESTLADVIKRQLTNPITLLLLGAGGVSLAVAQWMEAIAALAIAATTTYLGVRQEARAGQAVASLNKLVAPRAVVVREGSPLTVHAEEVVPGDLILLEEGDRVPADARVVVSAGLQVDESALTGESCPVAKDPNCPCGPATPLAERGNLLHAGTVVVCGRAQAVVVATGMQTEVGRVAALLEEGYREVTPLQRRLQSLAKWIFWGIIGVGITGAAVAIARGVPVGQAVAQSVSVAVSAMPQGLPVTVTIALSTAVARLAEQGAMTRRLGAMESLGSTTVICSDKTGTLTCNRLTVRQVQTAGSVWAFTGEQAEPDGLLRRVLTGAVLCNNARLVTDGPEPRVEGDATEGALLLAAAELGLDAEELRARHPRLHEVPFSSEQRRMSVVCETPEGPVLYVKGAPETVLPMCCRVAAPETEQALHDPERRDWLARAEAMAGQGLRVLAIAARPQEQPVVSVQKGLTLLGLAGMADAPRPGVRAAVGRCRDAGIRVVMLTGDHPATAAAIGREVGILGADSVVLTGPELDAMSDADLAAIGDRLAICARVAPEHKLRVVRMLKRQGHVVAMTGDGVNDAPALQAADTGIAMGVAGTEVTRGAANLVLTNDDFTSIVNAIEHGRSAYRNIRRALIYSLSTNGGEALLSLLPLAVGMVLPVPTAMLLITNMLCDGLVSLSLATDRPEPGVMQRPPRPQDEPMFSERTVRVIASRGAALGVSTVALYAVGTAASGIPGIGYSMALAGLVASKLQFAWAIRREQLGAVRVTPGHNPLLDLATLLGGGVTVAAIYIPALGRLFAMAPLGPVALGTVAVVVWAQSQTSEYLARRPIRDVAPAPNPVEPPAIPAAV